MKVKTVLKTLRNVEYVVQGPTGYQIAGGYVGEEYCEDCSAEDLVVDTITTVKDHDTLFITVKSYWK